jgi:hypothetical protein
MHRTRKIKMAALAATAAIGVALGVQTLVAASSGSTLIQRKVIASATAPAFRLQVVALKGIEQTPPAATVKVVAFDRVNGDWRQLGSPLRVGTRDGFFWNVITGPHAMRQFSISNDEPERGTLQLLITPSIGWSPLFRFHVEEGVLVRG